MTRPYKQALLCALLLVGVPLLLEMTVYLSRPDIFPTGYPVTSVLLALLYLAILFCAISAIVALLLQRIPVSPETMIPSGWFTLYLLQVGLRLLPYDSGFSAARAAVFCAAILLGAGAFLLLARRRPTLKRVAPSLWTFCVLASFSLSHLFEFPLHSPVSAMILGAVLFATLFFLPPVIPGIAAIVVILLQFQSRTDLPAFAPPRQAPPFQRVLLIGIDGLSPEVLRKMAFQDQLPSFRKIMDAGVSGKLHTLDVPFSPLVWNTIYTGTRPGQHGILAFTNTGVAAGNSFLSLWLDNWTNSDWSHKAVETLRAANAIRIVAPATAKSRRKPALWNMVEQNNAGSQVVGGWTTYPPEVIRGTFISDYAASASNPMGTYHPPSKQIEELLKTQPEISDGPDEIQKYRIKDARMHSASMQLLKTASPDSRFHFAYYCAVDAFGHHYGTHMDMKSTPAKRKAELLRMRADVYRTIDNYVGDYLQAIDENTLLIIVSDHGFHFDKREHNYSVDGAILMLGRNVRSQTTIEDSVTSIAPTVLYALGFAPSVDFVGLPIKQAFEGIIPQPPARKYDAESKFFEMAGREELDEEKLRELEDLQYIDR